MELWEANMSITDLFGPDREQWAVKKTGVRQSVRDVVGGGG